MAKQKQPVKLTTGAVENLMKKRISFPRLNEGTKHYNFLLVALQICLSNELLAYLTGLSSGTISIFRSEAIKKGKPIVPGTRYALLGAYNLYAKAVLQEAVNFMVPVNHTGYYNEIDLGILKTKLSTAPSTAAPKAAILSTNRLADRYSDEEKAIIAAGPDIKTIMDNLKGIGSTRTYLAVSQKYNIIKKREKKLAAKPSTEKGVYSDAEKNILGIAANAAQAVALFAQIGSTKNANTIKLAYRRTHKTNEVKVVEKTLPIFTQQPETETKIVNSELFANLEQAKAAGAKKVTINGMLFEF